MKAELGTPAGRDALQELINRFHLGESESAIIVSCLIGRLAGAVVHASPMNGGSVQRFHNVVTDLCRLGFCDQANAPRRALDSSAAAAEEVKCVSLWNASLNAFWVSICGATGIRESWALEANADRYCRWEEDFYLGIRLLARLSDFGPKGWKWSPDGRIPRVHLYWNYFTQSTDFTDNLLFNLVEYANEFDVPPEQAAEFNRYLACVRSGADAFGELRAHLRMRRMGHSPTKPQNKGLFAWFRKSVATTEPSLPELQQRYSDCIVQLQSIVGFV